MRRFTKSKKGGNGSVPPEAVPVKKEPMKGLAPVFSTPAELAQKLRNVSYVLTPIVVHLEGQECVLLAEDVGKVKKKLEELADLVSEVGRLGQQKDLFTPAPKEKLPADAHLAKTKFSKEAPKKPDGKSLAAGDRAEA